jgi:hypothetical protein
MDKLQIHHYAGSLALALHLWLIALLPVEQHSGKRAPIPAAEETPLLCEREGNAWSMDGITSSRISSFS